MTTDDWTRRDSAASYDLAMACKRRELLDQQGRDYHVTVGATFGAGRTTFQTKMVGKRAEAMAYADRDWPAALVFVQDMGTHEIWYRPANSQEWREGEGEDV